MIACPYAYDIIKAAAINAQNLMYCSDAHEFSSFITVLGVDVQTGEVFRAKFPDPGPDIPIRSACHFSGTCKNVSV